MTIFDFVSAMFDDASTYDAAAPMTIEDAATDLANFRAEGYCMPDDVTPETYAEAWNYLADQQQNGAAYREKAQQMKKAIFSVLSILLTARPDLHNKIDIQYMRETPYTVNGFSSLQRQYHGIRANEEYIYIWETTPEHSCLLYTVNVTADSILTAISELVDLLSRKF